MESSDSWWPSGLEKKRASGPGGKIYLFFQDEM
jgi:hypothetical protein